MAGNTHNRLVVFTRYPEPGRVKTRLIATLGERRAADLQRRMTERTLAIAAELTLKGLAAVEVHYDGGTAEKMAAVFGKEQTYIPQEPGAGLGDRLLAAFHRCFEEGADRVVIVGTDCPGLSASLMRRAFEELEQASLVLGPARDGGYYLIGLQDPAPPLFENMPWGTDGLFVRTVNRAREISLSTALLIPLDDVDRPEDLPVWESAIKDDAVR